VSFGTILKESRALPPIHVERLTVLIVLAAITVALSTNVVNSNCRRIDACFIYTFDIVLASNDSRQNFSVEKTCGNLLNFHS
jgi:hypothetical protein